MEPSIPAIFTAADTKEANGHPSLSETGRQLYLDTLPSVVKIQGRGQATGFFVDDKGTIATNAHVVDKSKELTATTADGKLLRLQITKIDEINDVAILKPVAPVHSKPVELATTHSLTKTSQAFAIGYPGGIAVAAISPGTFRSETGLFAMKVQAKNTDVEAVAKRLASTRNPGYKQHMEAPLLNFDMMTDHGSSGSPVLDANGKAVGVLVGGIPDLTLTTQAKHIRELLETGPELGLTYERKASRYGESFLTGWSEQPVTTALSTLSVGGAMGVTGYYLNRAAMARPLFSRMAGGVGAVSGLLYFNEDATKFMNSTDSRDEWKYGLSAGADSLMFVGGIATMAFNKKSYGIGTFAAGALSRMGCELIPNRLVLSENSLRSDGKPFFPLHGLDEP